MKKLLLLVLLLLPILAQGQATSHTAFRIRFGAALPATCNPATGDVFFKTAATIGAYECLTANAWTAMGGAGGAAFPLTPVTAGTTCAAPQYGNTGDSTGMGMFGSGIIIFCTPSSTRNIEFKVDLLTMRSAGVLGFVASATDPNGAPDLAISRVSPGILAVGTGAQGSAAGAVQLGKLSFKLDGAHLETNTANKDITGVCTFAATTCTVTFTTAYAAAPACQATDQTAAAPVRSAPTTSNVVFTGGTGAGATDVVAYHCDGNPN